VAGGGAERDQISTGLQAVHNQDLLLWLQHPVVGHAAGAQHCHLVHQISLLVRRRQDLTHPVGPDANRPPGRSFRNPIPPPTDKVVSIELVGLVLHADFGGDPPASGPSTARTPDETATDELAQGALCVAVFHGRARLLHDRAADDLGDDVIAKAG
jgi:hypothetical protein